MHKKPVKSAKTFFSMGCDAKCIVYGRDDVENRRLHQEVQDTLGRLQRTASFFNPDSEINRLPKGDYTPVSEELMAMLRLSQLYHKETEGFFDISMGTVKALWQEARSTGLEPSKKQIEAAFQSSGMKKIEIKENKVKIHDPTLRLDLGNIAKGYAVDACIGILAKAKVHGGLVTVGGDMRVFGSVPNQSQWKIGVQDPRPGQKILGYVNLTSEAIATSGNTAGSARTGKTRLGHIINPIEKSFQNGGGMLSVTIVSGKCAHADALSTAVFAMGLEKGSKYLKKRSDQIKYLVTMKKNGNISCLKNMEMTDFVGRKA